MRRLVLISGALLLALPISAAAPELPPFACPDGTLDRRALDPAPGGVHFATSAATSFRYCAEVDGEREVRRGPYRAFDPLDRWLALGEYGAAENGASRQVGLWRYRRPGNCGDWIEWERYHPRGPRDPEAKAHPVLPLHRRHPETGGCPAGTELRGTNVSDRLTMRCERSGVREGPTWLFYEDDGLHREVRYASGHLDGPFRSYHSNGALRWEGAFVAGRETGTWRRRDCEGAVLCEGEAVDGHIVDGWTCTRGTALPRRGWLRHDRD